jgi:hypothetical protein
MQAAQYVNNYGKMERIDGYLTCGPTDIAVGTSDGERSCVDSWLIAESDIRIFCSNASERTSIDKLHKDYYT